MSTNTPPLPADDSPQALTAYLEASLLWKRGHGTGLNTSQRWIRYLCRFGEGGYDDGGHEHVEIYETPKTSWEREENLRSLFTIRAVEFRLPENSPASLILRMTRIAELAEPGSELHELVRGDHDARFGAEAAAAYEEAIKPF